MRKFESLTPLISDFNVPDTVAASHRKENSLAQASDAIQARRLAEAEAERGAWVRNSELDSFSGGALNALNAFYQGGARVISNVVTLPDNAEASKYLSYLPDDVRTALNKPEAERTEEDKALLQKPININSAENNPALNSEFDVSFTKEPQYMLPEEILAAYQATQQEAQETKDFLTEDTWLTRGFNSLNRQNLIQDLDGAWESFDRALEDSDGVFDVSKAVAALTGKTLSKLADNPAASIEFAAESLPHALTATTPVTAATNAAGFTGDVFGQNLRDKEEIVSRDKQQELLGEAIIAGSLETVSNYFTAGIAGLAQRTSKKLAEEARDTLLGRTAGRVAKTTGTAATEAVVEGTQSAIENDAFGEDFNFDEDAKDVYQGAAIGIGATVATAAPGQTVKQAVDTVRSIEKTSNQLVSQSTEQDKARLAKTHELVNSTLVSEDYDGFVAESTGEVESGNKFDLTNKLNVILSLHNSVASEDSPDYDQGRKLATAFVNTVVSARKRVEDNLEEKQSLVAELEANENNGTVDTSRNAEIRQRLNEIASENTELTQAIEQSDTLIDHVLANQQKIKKVSEAVEKLSTDNDSTSFPEEVSAFKQRIVDELVINPDGLDVEQLDTLLESTHWTDSERQQLSAAASAKRARNEILDFADTAGKTADTVYGEVVTGSAENTGADQYRQRIAAALLKGDTTQAQATLTRLKTFAERHTAKARDFKLAFAPFQRRLDEGVNAPALTEQDQRAIDYVAQTYTNKKGVGFNITPASKNVVDSIQLEAAALNATVAEAEAMIANASGIATPVAEPQRVTDDVTPITESVVDQAPDPEPQVSEAVSESTENLVERDPTFDSAQVVLTTNTGESRSPELRAKGGKGLIGKVNNVIEQLKEAPETVLEFVDTAEQELTGLQAQAVSTFTKFADQVSQRVNELYEPAKDERVLPYQLHHQLADAAGFGPEVLAAISGAAFNWIAHSGSETLYNSRKDVANILGVKEEQVSREDYAALWDKGSTAASVAATLGSDIIAMLGITFDPETSNRDKLAELELSMGYFALGAMTDMGVLVFHKHDTTNLVRLAGDINQPFSSRFPAAIQRIMDDARNANGLLAKAMDSQRVPVPPSLEPDSVVPTKQKNTNRTLAKKIQSILKTAQQKAWGFAVDTEAVYQVLPESVQESIAGIVNDTAGMPYNMQATQQAKNEALRREIINYQEWRSTLQETGDLNQPFYFSYEVWKTQRTGIKNTLVNPQSSKLHRALVGLKSWRKTIQRSNRTAINKFKLAVAQGMGIDVDKLTQETALAEFENAFENNPAFIQAIESINVLRQSADSLSADEIRQHGEAIAAMVKEGGEDAHTYHALVNYARYADATADSFVSDLWIELDGITNGPVIGMMQFGNGAAQWMKSLLAKGGVFFNGETSYGAFKEAGHSDLYETLAKLWNTAMESTQSPLSKADVSTLNKVLGDIQRKLAKKPLMTNIYGAGINGIMNGLSETFFTSVDEQLYKATTEERQALLNALTALAEGKPLYKATGSLDQQRPNPAAMRVIRQKIQQHYQPSLEQGINQMFGGFIQNRQVFNGALNKVNQAFMSVFNAMVEQEEALLREDGQLEKNASLPQARKDAIMQQLQPIMPGLNTVFSNQAQDQLQLAKTKRAPRQSKKNERLNKNRVIFSRKLKGVNQKSFEYVPTVTQFTDIGVRGAIGHIHSLDATVALTALEQLDVLNVFDGFPSDVLNASKNASRLNTAFLKAMTTANPYRELEKMAEVAIINLTVLVEQGKAPENKAAVKLLSEVIGTARDLDARTAETRNTLLNDLNYVTQYNLEEGGYTPKRKAPAQPELAEPETSEWGALRDPLNPVRDPFARKLESLLAQSDNAKSVFTELFKGRKVASVQGTVINSLLDVIPSNLKVELIQPSSPLTGNADLDNAIKTSHGLYNPSTHTMYLRSSAFVKDGTNVETVAHELIHALTVFEMHKAKNPEQFKNVSSQSVRAVKELNSLITQVTEQLEARGEAPRKEWVENPEEFIAYALTNADFQNQLKGIKVKVNKAAKVRDALTQFVQTVSALVFGTKRPVSQSALVETMRLSAVFMDNQAQYVERMQQAVQPTTFAQRIQRMTSNELLQALGQKDTRQRSDSHKKHLAQLQDTLINSVTGSQEQTLLEYELTNGDEVDSYLNSLATGVRPFVASMGRLFAMSNQEKYVTEQLQALFDSKLMKESIDTVQLRRLWKDAKAQLSVTDFLDDPALANDPTAMALAQQRYDYLFQVSTKGRAEYSSAAGKTLVTLESDYLTRFAAMASTYQPLRDKLASLTPNTQANNDSGSLLKQLARFIEKTIEAFRNTFTRSRRAVGNTQQQIDILMSNLAVVERRARNRTVSLTAVSEKVHDKPNQLLTTAIKKGLGALSVDGLRNSKIGVVKATAQAATVLAQDRSNKVIDTIYSFREKMEQGRHGFLLQLVEEMRAITPNNRRFMDLLRWANRDGEQQRRQVKEWLRDLVNNSFAQPLTDVQQATITQALLKTDAGALLNDYSLADLNQLLTDSDYLKSEIGKLEAQLADSPESNYYLNQADALGLYMVTNQASNNLLTKNAHGIAHMFGTGRQVSESVANHALPLIDTLASLRAISYTSVERRGIAASVLQAEMRRTDGMNGIEFTLRQHQALKEEALMRNFDNDPSLMTKGHIYEQVNPHITVRWAEEGSADLQDLVAQGFEPRFQLNRDELDPETRQTVMLVREDGGQMHYTTGVLSMTNMSAKGTRVSQAGNHVGKDAGELVIDADINKLAEQVRQQSTALFDTRVSAKPKVGGLIPLFNPQGDIVDFRYEMAESVRESVLEKSYEVSNVLGSMAGNIVDKVSTENINSQTIDALYEQYDSDPDKSTYIAIHADSTDREIRQMWAMLPQGTRHRIGQTFGGNKLMVKKEMLSLIFGYRKASIGDVFQRELSQLTKPQKFLRLALEMTLGKAFGRKLELHLRNAENIWQTLVTMIKDIFVVKNIFTTLGNIMSNAALLMWSGVPIHHIIRDQAEGWSNAQRYNAHRREVYEIDRKLEALTLTAPDRKQLLSRQNELRHRMANNPVHELMEAGLFQTIVEDIDADVDPYSYKSKFLRRMDDKFDKVPRSVKTLGKYLFITQDTPLYRFLNHPIQMSDFAARYAQYKYLTKTQAEPESKERALQLITENFINYDVPTQRSLQYLNDMGLIMFSKYFLRIQKPLLRLFLEKPANLIMMLMSQAHFGFSAPSDSAIISNGILNRFHNPIGNLIDAPDEIATINALLHGTGIK